ncbi:MAG: class I SAM-dependent methyltransferase [Pseudomonadota bacterium]
MTNKPLQLGFSSYIAFDAQGRRQKGFKVLAILSDYLGDLDKLTLLDIGCSTGFMTALYAEHFRDVTGIDIDAPAVSHAAQHNTNVPNLHWLIQDSQCLGFRDAGFDVVICTHIYEHVPDAHRLMAEIHRVLKPGGVCFFSAGNRFSLMEPHYRLPLLSVIPKWLAHRYLALLGRGSHYYETHLSFVGLRKLVASFEVVDYTIRVVQEPVKFHAEDMIEPSSFKQRALLVFLKIFYGLCPTYLWVLKKTEKVD